MFYHYTSIEALYGIVSTRTIRFSSLAFMNDELEGYELGRVLSVVAKNLGDDDRQYYLRFVEATLDVFIRWQFCFCASRLRDDISQWRGYTTLGSGVCLEFSDDLIRQQGVERFDCIYNDSAKQEAIAQSSQLNCWGNDVFENFKAGDNGQLSDYVWDLVHAIARFKHASFAPEQETRWCNVLSVIFDGEEKCRAIRLSFRKRMWKFA